MEEWRAEFAAKHELYLHMFAIVVGAILAGPVASKLFLDLGITAIHVRYPLAAVASYVAFIALIRLWLRCVGWKSERTRNMSWWEQIGGPGPSPGDSQTRALDVPGFGGGRSDGGGTSDQWGSRGNGVDAASGVGDLGEILGWLVVLVGCVVGIGAWFISSAEIMLPQIAEEAFKATFLTPDAWLYATLRSSWLAFGCVFAVTVKLGLSIHHHFPEAVRLADVFAQ